MKLTFEPIHIEDWTELFYNGNDRDAVIQLDVVGAANRELARTTLTLKRATQNQAFFEQWFDWDGQLVRANSQTQPNVFGLENGCNSGGDITDFVGFADRVSNSFYVGPFRNAISEGSGLYYDVAIGTSFISIWDSWKTGGNRRENLVAQAVTDDIAHIFDFKRLEINASANNNTLQVIVDGHPFRLRELGAGLAQFIIVLGNVAIKRPSLIMIDEPELNLHPSLQLDFLTSLASHAAGGMMFATHSIGLARASSDRLYSFQRLEQSSLVKRFEQAPNFAEFMGEMSFSSFQELGCDRVLLVEGVTDVKAVQQWLRLLRKDHETVLIPLGGSQMIRDDTAHELADLRRLSNNVAVLIDSERLTSLAELDNSRATFVDTATNLGLNVHVTERRAFENYLSDAAVKAEKGNEFRALTEFERLSDVELGWAKRDNWRIARRMTLDEVVANDVGRFLQEL